MTNWQTSTIGELVDYEQPSKYLVKDTNYIEDGTPVLTANKAFVLGYTHETEGIYVASKDSPVIIFDDFTTDNKFVDFDFKVKSSAIKVLIAKHGKALPRFVHGAMQLIKTEITEHKRRFISEYQFHPIDTPEIVEQQRIVGVLEVWDEYIEKLEQKIALKEQLKKGLMQQLLTGKRRLPGFSDEWERKPISELFEVKNGYTPSKSNPDFWDGGTIPWFRMEDIRKNGRILKDSIQKITPQAVKGGKLFPANSIIMSTTATIGEHALLIADSLANQQFTFLVRKVNCLEILDPRYVFYQCYPLAEWCKNNVNEGGLTAVDMNGLKKYKLPVPSAEEQKAIVEVLDVSTRNIELLKDELENIQSQKKYLLKNLITGTIRTPEDLQPLDTSRLERSAL